MWRDYYISNLVANAGEGVLTAMRFIAVDTETTLIPPQGTAKVNVRHSVPDLVVTTYSIQDGEAGLLTWEEKDLHWELFTDSPQGERCYVFHNAAFDISVLVKAFPELRERFVDLIRKGRILDTRVMYLNRHPDPPHRAITLEYLADKLLNVTLAKGKVRTSFRRDMDLTTAQKHYAKQDAAVTRQVAESLYELPMGCFRNTSVKQKLIGTHPLTNSRHPDILYSSAAALTGLYLVPTGMKINSLALKKLYSRFKYQVVEYQVALHQQGLVRMERMPRASVRELDIEVNENVARSWTPRIFTPPEMMRRWAGKMQVVDGIYRVNQEPLRQLFKSFAEQHGIKPPLSKKTKQISLARDGWKDYYSQMPDTLQLYMDYQRTNKYLTSFLAPLILANAKEIHPVYWIPGAATGRWSCSKICLHQTPRKDVRSIYCAREGYTFIMADYPTLELYTLAHTMKCMDIEGPLMESLRLGEDIHSCTAAMMWSLSPDEVKPEQRRAAKAANFGLPGGMGVKRFQITGNVKGLPWTRADAYEIRKRWFDIYWDVQQYLNAFELNAYEACPSSMSTRDWLLKLGFDPEETWPSSFKLSQKLGGLYTCALPTGRTIPERTYSAAANIFFQGLGADVITEAFVKVCLADMRPVAVVHDSITIEVPLATEEPAPADPITIQGKLLTKIMENSLLRICPTVPRPQIGYKVSSTWK